MSSDTQGYSFKIVVVGSSGVGKTSIVRQLIDGRFQEEGQPTIGVEFKTYSLTAEGEAVKLQIWDTAGQERFRSVSKAYFRNALGAILVYDITSRQSFDDLSAWISDFQTLASPNAPVVLIGNKNDMVDDRQIEESEADEFAKRYNLTRLETSAKTGDHVAEAFARLGQDVLREYKKGEHPIEKEKEKVTPQPQTAEKKDRCC